MKMYKLLAMLLCAVLAMMSLAGFAALAESDAGSGFAYEHDPRENPNAMKVLFLPCRAILQNERNDGKAG